MAILQVNNISKYYGRNRVLENINLTVTEGKIFGLLGPNGAGKTTLLRLITGLSIPDEGYITLNEEIISEKNNRLFGYIPEERGLYPSLTVIEQILYFAQLKGYDKKKAKTNALYWLEKFDIIDKVNIPTIKLSKGNQQIVQIISSIAHQPQLLILDEPMSGFDPNNIIRFNEVIDELATQNTSIILSTHNMNAVEKLCDNLLLINSGKMILEGELPFLKRQFSSPKFNVITSTPLSLTNLFTFELIDNLSDYYHYLITPNNAMSNNDIISIIIQQSQIISFIEEMPTINDIFIKCTQQNE